MIVGRLLAALVAIVTARRTFAQIVATTPGPNETYLADSTCKIAWDVDASGTWTNMSIGEFSSFIRHQCIKID